MSVDIARIARDRYKESTSALSSANGVDFYGWLKEAGTWYKIISGEQWGTEDFYALKEMNRPAITFNRAGVMIDVVAGLELQNRLEPSFFPRDYADAQVSDTRKAEYLNGILKWVRDEADMNDEESSAFTDLLISGMGWTLTTLDYSEDPDGKIEKFQVDPLRCRWDVSCHRKNLRGSRWRMYVMDMTQEEIERRWPKVELKGTAGPWDVDIDQMYGQKHYLADQQWRYDESLSIKKQDESVGQESSLRRVVLYQYVKYEDGYRISFNNQSYNLTKKEFNDRRDDIERLDMPYVSQSIRKVRQAHILGDTVLDDRPTLTGKFTLQCMTGKYDKSNKCFYGLTRPMKDPQMWANKFISSVLDIVATNAKGGLMAETGAFVNERKAQEEWARNDKITFLNQGGIGKVGPKPISPLPPGIQYLLEYTSTMFPHTSGISLEMMGLVGQDQPGVLEYQRKQAGMSILAWAFNALRLYRKEDARNIIEIVRNYMDDGRMVRIEGDSGPELVQIVRDEMSMKYDVNVDESPMSVNSKERTWAMMVEIIPTLLKAGIPIPPSVIKYSPLPEQFKIEWMEFLKNQNEEGEEKQESTPVEQATVMEKITKAEVHKAQAAKEKTQAQLNAVKAKAEASNAGAKIKQVEIEGMKARSELTTKEIQMVKDIAETRLKNAQANNMSLAKDDTE